jgi:peptidoglycan hydrolase-like protein with peptidoglycan-binding domain
MRRGSRGESVASLQTQLRNRGYSIRYGADGSGRGFYGEQTEAAVRAFQRDNGLMVDGVAGPQTLATLNGGGSAPVRTAPAVATGGSSLGKYRVATNSGRGLNVRTGPGTQYGIATSLSNQAVVDVSGMRNGWAQIAPGRFVSANFIRKM